MVFFTCANCGESLKKNKVDKHYQTACARNAIALTCVDCCKDFSAETYPAHTKCISEEEKYSAKGFAPRPSANKGELKQQKWQEIIQSVRDSHRNSLSKEEQMILDIIVKHENVPRKKNKFQNFLRSLMKNRYNAQAADGVFDKLEAVSKQNSIEQGSSDKQNESVKEDEKENTSAVIKNSGDNPEEGHEGEKLSKKERKEKRKREKYEAELKEVESNQIPQVEDGSENEPKKKKKKSKKGAAVVETENEKDVPGQENVVSEDVEVADGEKSKKKNKKNKAVTENGVSEDLDMTEGKKSKKKHKKDGDIVEDGVPEDSGVVEEKKSKKKRKKGQDAADDLCDEEPTVKKTKEGTEETAEEVTAAGKTKFNWQETIIKILESRDNKEIPIKRLRKKIVAEFEATGGDSATSEKALAKFNKKVHHTPGVVVLKDVVKLVGTN